MMQKKISILLMIGLIILSITACTTSDEAVVAKINDRTITYGQFNKYYSIYSSAIQGQDVDTKELKEKILDEIVQMEVVKEYIAQNDIAVDHNEVEKQYTEYMDYLDSDEEAKEYLTDNNISDEFVKELITNQLYASVLYDKIASEIENPDSKVEEYYENNKEKFVVDEVKASHILVDTKEEAEDILEKIKNEEDFAKLAKTYSKDGSAQNGGDLGYFSRGRMIQSFEEAAFALDVGEVSDIVETQYGFHIIKVTDKINGPKPLSETRDYALSLMYDEYYQAKINEFMDTMDIEKYPEKLS